MGSIRDRVAIGSHRSTPFPGVAFKCFLIRVEGQHGAEAHRCAPVYLWPLEEQTWGFQSAAVFTKIKADLGLAALDLITIVGCSLSGRRSRRRKFVGAKPLGGFSRPTRQHIQGTGAKARWSRW